MNIPNSPFRYGKQPMKTESLRNILWVVQYRQKTKPGCKKKPWRIFSKYSQLLIAFPYRDEARIAAAGQAGLHPQCEFRPRRYNDTGRA